MKRRGPDSLEGWFIAFICCLISTLMYGASGLSGLLFVASVDRFDVNRNQASFPYTLSTVLQATSGLFAGYFASRFGSRIVILVGSILGFVGIGACFFAENILAVIILWGIVFGIGFGLSSLLLPVIINEYFFKQRSIALGMSYLGSPIGFFIFPPIFETLLNKYGLSGTFLILSGINMHCIPLSMLLKSPNFKLEHENCPLKNGEKHESYASTDSTKTALSEKPKITKELTMKTEIESSARRHSIEFLWKPFDSKELANDNKYQLSLSKKCFCEDSRSKIERSFKKTNKKIYENSDENDNKKLQHALDCNIYKSDKAVCKTTKQDKNYSNSNYLKTANNSCCQKYEQDPKNITTPTESNLGDKNTQLPCTLKKHEHEVISTIYFGTGHIPTDCNSHDKSKSDEKNKHKRTENILNYCYQTKYDSVFDPAYSLKIPVLLKYEKTDDFYQYKNSNMNPKNVISGPKAFGEKTSHSQNLISNMYLNPIFILICIINAIVNIHFTALITVIIDFSRDENIDLEYEKYIMMGISLSGAFGMMGFGWVTDGGYLTRTNFGAFTQLISSICTAVLPFTVGFETLMIALLIWCICQSSFIPLIPAITADYFDEDIQGVAVTACNVLSGPLYLVIPTLIGYFRDGRGSYDNIFYLLGGLAFMDCIIILTLPCIARWRSEKAVK